MELKKTPEEELGLNAKETHRKTLELFGNVTNAEALEICRN